MIRSYCPECGRELENELEGPSDDPKIKIDTYGIEGKKLGILIWVNHKVLSGGKLCMPCLRKYIHKMLETFVP